MQDRYPHQTLPRLTYVPNIDALDAHVESLLALPPTTDDFIAAMDDVTKYEDTVAELATAFNESAEVFHAAFAMMLRLHRMPKLAADSLQLQLEKVDDSHGDHV